MHGSAPHHELGRDITPRKDDASIKQYAQSLWDKLHILAGAPGTGKTTIACDLAARLTVDGYWPDGTRAQGGNVLIWSGEDDPSDTLAPRLKAMGADMSQVYFVVGVKEGTGNRPFDPATDMAALAEAVAVIKPVLLIVDPIVSAVAGDSHKNTETRRALQPLVDLAAKHNVAVLGITHFSKGSSGRNPTERVTGSLAFGALARVVMAAAKIEDDQGCGRIFCRAKSNIGADDGGFHYDLLQKAVPDHSIIMASCVTWGAVVVGSARQLLANAEATENAEGGSLATAKEFLETELAAGPVSAKIIKTAAEQAGISAATIRRAKDALGIKPGKDGMKGGWHWALPSKMLKIAEDVQQNEMSTFGENEHLRTPICQHWETGI